MLRRTAIQHIRERLAGRQLAWFGLRSADAESLSDYDIDTNYFGVTSPLQGRRDVSLEKMTGKRVNLNAYDLEADFSEEADQFFEKIKYTARCPSAFFPYRPYFRTYKAVTENGGSYLGLAPQFYGALNNKYAVEQAAKRLGIRTIDYRRIDSFENKELMTLLARSPVVIRSDFSAGGINLWLISSVEELRTVPVVSTSPLASAESAALYCFAPFLNPSIPLNIGACVNRNGQCSLHTLSLQVIGHRLLTRYALGCCGNDFATARMLDASLIEQVAVITQRIGKWLGQSGFIGAFGLDLLVHDGTVYFVELNPRFQGSSPLSAFIEKKMDVVDIYTAHLCAWLDIDYEVGIDTFVARTKEQPAYAHLYFQNLQGQPVHIDALPPTSFSIDLLPDPQTQILGGGTLFRAIAPKEITRNGWVLVDEIYGDVERLSLLASAFPSEQRSGELP